MGAPITGIRVAKPTKALKQTRHVIRAKVHGVHTHHTGKHVTLELRHGPRPKPNKKRDEFMSSYDQPSSSIAIPQHLAKHYPVGSQIHIGLAPSSGEPDADDEA